MIAYNPTGSTILDQHSDKQFELPDTASENVSSLLQLSGRTGSNTVTKMRDLKVTFMKKVTNAASQENVVSYTPTTGGETIILQTIGHDDFDWFSVSCPAMFSQDANLHVYKCNDAVTNANISVSIAGADLALNEELWVEVECKRRNGHKFFKYGKMQLIDNEGGLVTIDFAWV